MEEENEDASDDDSNQSSTSDWLESILWQEDQENYGIDCYKEGQNAHQEEAAYPKQEVSGAGNKDVRADGDMDAFADTHGVVDVDEHMGGDGDMGTYADIDGAVDVVKDIDADVDMDRSANAKLVADVDMGSHVLWIHTHERKHQEFYNRDAHDTQDARQQKIRDLKGKGILSGEQPLALNATMDDAVYAASSQNAASTSRHVASTSQYVAAAHQPAALSAQNANTLGGAKMDAMPSTSDGRVRAQQKRESLQGHEEDASETPNHALPFQNWDKLHILDFMDGVDMDKMKSTPDWSKPGDLPVREEHPQEEHIRAQQQYRSRTPDWSTPASSFQNADKLHVLNFMDDVNMDTMKKIPDWSSSSNLSPQQMQALTEHTMCEEQAEAKQAHAQYVLKTPDWFVPPAENVLCEKNARMKETTRRDRETVREENMEGAQSPVTYTQHPSTVPEVNEIFMNPLPDMDELLKLPIYNTYHHHHVHELRKGNFDRSCPKSTSTDPCYHTHTSQHKPTKVEIRLFTFNCDSSVVAYFRDNQVNVRVTSTQPATYTTLVVRRNLVEFIHHIVHRHDVHVVDSDYQDNFNLISVCSQICTQTNTQCRLFGPVGDFLHTHFHEFIHTIFVSAPIEEDATVYSEYLHLATICRPKRRTGENTQHQQEMGAGDPSTSAMP